MTLPEIVTGDDTSIPIQLQDTSGNPFIIDIAATVEATIVDDNHRRQYFAPVAQDSAAGGANWSASLVVIEFTSANTSGLPDGPAMIEIQVEEGGVKSTWFQRVVIVTGTIT